MARKQIKVTVIQRDIDRAVRGNSQHCAVATALARCMPDAHHFDVDTSTVRFSLGERRYVYLTPWQVQNYVVAFDAGDAIEPFEFTLRNPFEVRRRRRVTTELLGDNEAQREARKRRKSEQMSKAGKASAAKRKAESEVSVAPTTDTTTSGTWARKEPVPGTATRKPPPRVFKTSRRDYGHRVLRINRGS